jgi:hypothetical protein
MFAAKPEIQATVPTAEAINVANNVIFVPCVMAKFLAS